MRYTDTRHGNLHCLYVHAPSAPYAHTHTHACTHTPTPLSMSQCLLIVQNAHAPLTCTLSAVSHTPCPRVSPGWRWGCASRGPTMAAEEVGVVIQLLAPFLANSLLIWERGEWRASKRALQFICVSVCVCVHMPAQALIPNQSDCVITHSSNPLPSAHATHSFPSRSLSPNSCGR